MLHMRERSENQRQPPHPAGVHEGDQDQPGQRVKPRRDPERQPDGADGGSGLEEAGKQRQRLRAADDESAEQKQRHIEKQDGDGLPEHAVVNSSAEAPRLAVLTQRRGDREQHDREGAHLHPAGRRTRCAADQ